MIRLLPHITDIPAASWDALEGSAEPFLSYQWLQLLEQNGSVSTATGWQPQHLGVFDQDVLLAAMPLYLKTHSLGEYVFDQSWAQAYRANGLEYYPKLVSCIPFTPVQGERLLFHPSLTNTQRGAITAQVLAFLQNYCRSENISGAHILFAQNTMLRELATQNSESAAVDTDTADAPSATSDQAVWSQRIGVQFHWFNRNYHDFEDFLARCNSKRRKEIRRERRIAREHGLQLLRLRADEISEAVWLGCLRCYQLTNLQYNRHFGYLTDETFRNWLQVLRPHLLVAIAVKASASSDPLQLQAEDIVAAAIFMFDQQRLYGRYWGAFADYPALHFELCYYQGIEFCIENQLQEFDPGAQGEHKVPRGFEPISTYSLHWLAHNAFHDAVSQFVLEEASAYQDYRAELTEKLPFKVKEE